MEPCSPRQCGHIIERRGSSFDFVEIQRSAAASCRTCRLYEDIILAVVGGRFPGLFEGSRKEDEKQLILNKLRLGGLHWACLYGEQYCLPFNILERQVCIEIFLQQDENTPCTIQGRRIHTATEVGPFTNSNKSFERARQWLSECVSNHNCSRLNIEAPQPLPKRLVDIRGSPGDLVRVVDTTGVEHPYACLSHRWGSPEHRRLTTTVRNIKQNLNEIPWDRLPATFRDATTICRRMGIHYIWIDSLCILQEFAGIMPEELDETRKDFANENAAMKDTYRNSHFTILADISSNMDSGIFSKVPFDCQWIEVVDDEDISRNVYFRECPTRAHSASEPPGLETRGWTFQESLLPSRVLHFGSFDVEWRCKRRLTCECTHMEYRPWDHQHTAMAEIAASVPNKYEALKWWEQVLHRYTARQLTKSSDKLPALSGMAQLYRQACEDTYLAGHWRHSLEHDLCWYYTSHHHFAGSGGVGCRPVEYRAPSWSWASIDIESKCCFWWEGDTDIHPMSPSRPTPVCKIVEAFCQPKTADPTGEVRFGFLDIEAVLIPARIGGSGHYLHPRTKAEIPWTIGDADTDLAVVFFKPDCDLVDDNLTVGERIYCAPILEDNSRFCVRKGCLVLKKLYAEVYQRIGFCELRAEAEDLADSTPSFNAQDYGILEEMARIIII